MIRYSLIILLRQVVFRSGQGALQVLPPLVDVIPEARLNLVIYHLRQGGHWAATSTVCLLVLIFVVSVNFYNFCVTLACRLTLHTSSRRSTRDLIQSLLPL